MANKMQASDTQKTTTNTKQQAILVTFHLRCNNTKQQVSESTNEQMNESTNQQINKLANK
jgi:hypothetical protein